MQTWSRFSHGNFSRLISAFLLTWCIPWSSADAVVFNFDVPTGTDPLAVAGFVAAGVRWSDALLDDIAVNISIAFDDIPSNTGATILGSTGSSIFAPPAGTTAVPNFLKLKTALKADVRSIHDRTATENFPEGATTLKALTNDRDGMQILDSDASGNNTFFRVTTANAKALGILAGDATGEDASISFNSSVNFDFDPSNGITPGAIDFIGVATHEIGHALGFVSGVDFVDQFGGDGPSANTDLNGTASGIGTLEPFALFGTLDLFRRSNASIAISPDVMDLSTGGAAFFSLDGKTSSLSLETGSFNGTGQQASHFLDSNGIGIMDPTAGPGELLQITNNDLLVFDAIGYDLDSSIFPLASACDFDNDGDCDVVDLDLLYDAFGPESKFDLDESMSVDESDITAWLALASDPQLSDGLTFKKGDVDLSGNIDSADLGSLLNSFGNTNRLGWGSGNFNGDGNIDSADLGSLLNNFGFTSQSPAAAAVPEPSSPILIYTALLGLIASRRRSRS